MRAGRPGGFASRLAVLAAVLSLGSCSFWDEEEPCDSVEEYQFAQAAPEISVPAGLDKPDPAAKLKVPEEPVPAEPLSKNAACLQRPPNYFDKPLKDATN